MTLPGAWLEEYLEATALGSRLTILAGRFPLPTALETRILASVDSLQGELLVRASGLSCGPSGLALWSAGTRAALLYAIRAAWSRAYAPAVGGVPVWPTIAVVERSAVPAEELAGLDRWT